jgi:thioredoxin-related protein
VTAGCGRWEAPATDIATTDHEDGSMHHRSIARALLLGCLWLAGTGLGQAGDFNDATVMHIAYPDWFKETFFDLPEDIDEARVAGKEGLMILFTTEGCSYCAEFIRTSLTDPELVERLRARFDVIGLDIFSDMEMTAPDGTEERVKTFAKRAGAGFSPTVLFFGEGGAPLYRGVGYYDPERFGLVLDYLSEGDPSAESFAAFVRAREAQSEETAADYRLEADPLFSSPPYALDRSQMAADRPLLVIFETDGCADCAGFHQQVLAAPKVRELLARFDVVRLNAADDQTPVQKPDGEGTTPAAWWAATGLSRQPALMFFDERGQEVLSTDALVIQQRMLNSLMYVLERAYAKDWTYQRFARSRALERINRAREEGED